MQKLSAVVITLNEETTIEGCLQSLKGIADEIVVLDSFSTDRTKEICEQWKVNFHQREWEGFAQTKNFANTLAAYNTILSIDADERLDEQLQNELLDLKIRGFVPPCQMRRKNYFGDIFIKHCGWYPDWKIRIFDRRNSNWSGGPVHEMLETTGSVTSLRGHIIHQTVRDSDHQMQTIHKYARLAAEGKKMNGKKVTWLDGVWGYIKTFIKCYFLKLGFMDGDPGFIISRNSARSKWLRYKYFQELSQKH
ncbi:MAG: glycosyltransferase [Bacteroidetes bacterium]|nr:glycosyltransferase [Bacteroidota bacterium]